jgi:hypothetical protein
VKKRTIDGTNEQTQKRTNENENKKIRFIRNEVTPSLAMFKSLVLSQ